MRTVFDLSPLYRSTVGFDRLFDMLDRVSDAEPVPAWPAYNVEKVGDDHYRIVMAVAGFEPDEIEIVQKDGKPHARLREGGKAVLHPLTKDGAKYLKRAAKWYGKF